MNGETIQDWEIIDAHAHCGRQFRYPPQDIGDYRSAASGSGIRGVVVFAPVAEIYDRDDYGFRDTEDWRERRESANEYLLHLGDARFEVIPYFFIWNDFAVEQITPAHQGIKWHRHSDEPEYHYDDPRCAAAVAEIRRRNLPVVLEEEFHNTLKFLDVVAPGCRVIIPHCGMLNGGYDALVDHGVWARENVFADTALAPPSIILDYLKRYGDNRILFGSDFPFGDPKSELRKILRLDVSDETRRGLLSGNLRRLLAGNRS